MEVPEFTEFLMGLLTAVEIKDFFTDTMVNLCESELDEYSRISPPCFRRNFLNVMETIIPGDGRSIADYMPFMHQYIKKLVSKLPEGAPITDSPGFLKFMIETESFTRTCMYYDKNGKDEVFIKAYKKTYIGALIALVKEKVGSEYIAKRLAKPIFQYLVKYGKIPDTGSIKGGFNFLRFLAGKNKNAPISRTTISTMLKTIGNQSDNAEAHPYKCEECLRDPTVECMPEGESWL
jgi:hypothetical protein